MSRLLDELDGEERRRAQRALDGCPIVAVPAAGRAELPEAALLSSMHGIACRAAMTLAGSR
jgi:hypothetical protein